MNSIDLQKLGFKVTGPRLKVLQALSERKHISAEDIYQSLVNQGQELSLATIYRILGQFLTAGLVSKHNFESGQAVFELVDEDQHDHIICNHCARIEEFTDELLEIRQQEVAQSLGFTITDRVLVLYGVCESCRLN